MIRCKVLLPAKDKSDDIVESSRQKHGRVAF